MCGSQKVKYQWHKIITQRHEDTRPQARCSRTLTLSNPSIDFNEFDVLAHAAWITAESSRQPYQIVPSEYDIHGWSTLFWVSINSNAAVSGSFYYQMRRLHWSSKISGVLQRREAATKELEGYEGSVNFGLDDPVFTVHYRRRKRKKKKMPLSAFVLKFTSLIGVQTKPRSWFRKVSPSRLCEWAYHSRDRPRSEKVRQMVSRTGTRARHLTRKTVSVKREKEYWTHREVERKRKL